MRTLFLSIGALALAQTAAALELSVTFDGKAQTGDYSFADRAQLQNEIEDQFSSALNGSDCDAAVIAVNVIKALPNSAQSSGLTTNAAFNVPNTNARRLPAKSGIWLEATAFDAEGNELATLERRLIQRDTSSRIATKKWANAYKGTRRFAREFAEKL